MLELFLPLLVEVMILSLLFAVLKKVGVVASVSGGLSDSAP